MDVLLVQSLWSLQYELLLIVSAMLLLLYGSVKGNESTDVVMFYALGAMVISIYGLMQAPAESAVYFNGLIRIDGFTQFTKALVLLGAVLTGALSMRWLQQPEVRRFEFPVLMLLSVSGMMIMISANNLLTLYMGLELSSLALYVLAAFDRDNKRSSEAGLKYFILGALASGMFLFGASLVYGFSGTTDYVMLQDVIAQSETVSPGLVIGLVFVLVGLCFKVSAVPFHMWTPDVYEGAPTVVTAFFAVVPKIAALALLVRVLNHPFGGMEDAWQQIIIFVSIASMLVGAFGALTQTNIKRLLAYSSIGHVGYLLVGVAAANTLGVQALLVYFMLYLFMSVGMFGFVTIMKRKGKPAETLEDLAGLSKTCPMSALFVAIMMFSMAGIPPLAGFFGKMMIFLAAIDAELYTLAVIGVLSSVVAAYYYIKVVKIMYFDDEQEPFDCQVALSTRAVLLVCGVVTAAFFIYPSAVLDVALQAALALQ